MNTDNNKSDAMSSTHILPKLAMDNIPQARNDAMSIIGLMKSGGSVTGYQLSDGSCISREQGVEMAEKGMIKGVGVAHNGDTVYLKSIPDGSEDNNLSHLPTVK